jgi:hypothetical protein
MSERRDHSKNFTGTGGIQLFAKSFILQVYDVLATHSCSPAKRRRRASEAFPTKLPVLSLSLFNLDGF